MLVISYVLTANMTHYLSHWSGTFTSHKQHSVEGQRKRNSRWSNNEVSCDETPRSLHWLSDANKHPSLFTTDFLSKNCNNIGWLVGI